MTLQTLKERIYKLTGNYPVYGTRETISGECRGWFVGSVFCGQREGLEARLDIEEEKRKDEKQ